MVQSPHAGTHPPQTLGRLRREIEPVTAQQFMLFLCRWQHIAPGAQLHGADGALEIVQHLQGYEISGGGLGIADPADAHRELQTGVAG